MGLMQQALETYEYAKETFAGEYIETQREPLAPVGHTIANATIEITINHEGEFLRASAVSDTDSKTIIPVTEASSERTGKSAPKNPHPLCDKLSYYIDEEKYLQHALEDWASSAFTHPKVRSILKYLQSGTILEKLEEAKLIKRKDGKIQNSGDIVRWIVTGTDSDVDACWMDKTLMESFIAYNESVADRESGICMLSGEVCKLPARPTNRILYPAVVGKLKIISSNDTKDFTYLGRFINAEEVVTAGYVSSQKAHNALRWLIANQGECIDKQYFLCWNPQGKKILTATQGFGPTRQLEKKPVYTPISYRESLHDTLKGWKSTFAPNEKAVTAVFSTTSESTSRLSLIYYSELQATDFLDRLAFWDETCCWQNRDFGIQSPSIYKIAEYAFGTLRTDPSEADDKKKKKQKVDTLPSVRIEADDKIKKQAVLRLLSCRLERAKIPRDIVRQLVQKSGNLHLYEDSEKTKYLRSQLLFITCATIKKYRYDYDKEDWSMALEPEKQDRSYQFGRLLAVMEKIERDTYSKEEKRETNAIRRQMAFVARPFSTFASVMGHLKNAYYPQLTPGGRAYYDKLVGQITEQLSAFTSELNQPLAETYLLGYYLQRNDFYTKKETSEE